MSKPEFTSIDPPEKMRVYIFAGGEKVSFENVTGLAVSKSGTHRLETVDGRKHIVPVGWLSITLEMDDWTL